jgi:type II secretory pathway pseudopilin PulG
MQYLEKISYYAKIFKVKGFSIIEIVMVILIGSIIGAVIILGLKSPSDPALELATKKIKNDLSYVREKAISTNKKHKIYITTPDTFKAGFANFTLMINPENQSEFIYNLGDKYPKVTFFKNYSIVFDSLGRNTYKNQTSIILKSGPNFRIIKVDNMTGRIYVQ